LSRPAHLAALAFVTRILVAGGAATGVVLALVGCGGSITSSPNGAGTGIVLSPPPPFAIAAAPASATYETCDSLSPPFPIGFLADGRAAVGQYVRLPDRGAALVRAWDPRTNTLERLFIASATPNNGSDDMLRIDRDGRRIFDVRFEQLKVYDVARRGFLTGEAAVPVGVRAVSDGGNFVLDGDLRRYTASGEVDFDFKPLLPAEVPFSQRRLHLALSFAGDAVAVAAWEVPGGTPAPVALVLYQDGRVVRLPDAPDISECWSTCGMSWSADGRHLLLYAGSLRVWEVATAQLIGRLDDGVSSAGFSPDGAHIVTGGDGGLIERDLSGAARFTWPIQGDPRTAVGPQGKMLGTDSTGLVVATRDRTEASWRQPEYGWPGALALTSDAIFAIVFDWERPSGSNSYFHLMLARFAVDRAGPTAVFRPEESQSEWLGQVALSPDEKRVAVVFPDSVRILDAATLAPLATIPAGAGMIAWSPDGRYVAATPDFHYRDGNRPVYRPSQEVTVWNASSGSLAARLPAPTYPQAIAFDERGGTVVGWGYPTLTVHSSQNDTAGTSFSGLTQFGLDGDAAGFAIDLVTSTSTTSNLPPFIAATRELVATEYSIVALSTGTTLSAISAPLIGRGVFSSDFSVLLAVDRAEATENRGIRLVAVANGGTIAGIPMLAGNPDRVALGVARGGRRVAAEGHVACAR
jgi:WD40 repeat protein